jgi:nitrogen fixation/metabolism regulation signal transduction histidine kinase
VVRPVSRLAARADVISRGELDVPELPVRGRDEISVLAASFNRMHRSVAAAMKLLDRES